MAEPNRSRRTATLRTLPLLALLAPLLVLLPAAPAVGASEFDVRIRPSNTANTAVRVDQTVTVSGRVPRGELRSARLVAVEADQDEHYQDVPVGGAEGPSDFLRADDGVLSGRLTLGCLFGPNLACGGPRQASRQVHLEVVVAGAEGRSSSLRVDYDRPAFRDALLVAPDRVLVRFTEPVRQLQGELPGDFLVRQPDSPVVAVLGATAGDCRAVYGPQDDTTAGDTGCTRTLVLGTPLDEDAAPVVDYFLQDNRVPQRTPYDDFASNRLLGSRSRTSSDSVRPPTPDIRKVDGRPTPSSGRVDGSQPPSSVEVGNLRPGHVAFVRVVQTGLPTSDGAEVTASGETAVLPVPALGGEGTYTLQAVVRDPAGNVSTDGAKRTARADREPSAVTYVVDRSVPSLLSAVTREGGVEVAFTEPVEGSDSSADWTIRAPDGSTRTVTRVSGSGARRQLDAGAVPPGSSVAYRPTAVSQPYADQAGNQVPSGSTATADGVALPVVTSPGRLSYTPADSTTIRGTAQPGRLVEVFRDGNDDGAPEDETALAADQLGGGETEFVLTVPLRADGAHDFVVRARDTSGSGAHSGFADVPRVVRDTAAPGLRVARPTTGEVLAGGSDQEIVFDVEDQNAGAAPVRIEFSADGGRSWGLVTAGTADESYTWRVPGVSTDDALLRLTATDLATNRTVVDTGRFAVDAAPPVFRATTRDARTVVVVFHEAVSGSSTALDWRVEGEPASGVAESTSGSQRTVVLTTGPRTTVEPDEQPEVEYRPATTVTEYRDRAQQAVPLFRRTVQAADGILPATPSVTAPDRPVLTREGSTGVSGRTDTGSTVLLLDPQGDEVGRSARPSSDGAWTAAARLRPDADNHLRAVAVDRNGNSSASTAPVARIEQDATDPAVTVTEPQGGTRVEPGQEVTVRWTSTDRNLQDGATVVEASTDGGASWTTLAERQPGSGSLVWRAPGTTTSDARLRVSTTDRAGRTGRATSGPLGIGTAPVGSSTPSASSSPTAPPTLTPELPPLRIAVEDGTIVPGELSAITVTGRPGTRVELRAYSRPSTTYGPVRSGVLDAQGRRTWQVRPGTNTRLFARAVDGSGQGDSRSAVVGVRTALSLTVVRHGRRDYTFQGRILPRRAGQLITLYRVQADGQRIITAQLRTDATGTYRLRRVFTGSGRFGFLTRTGSNLTNLAGESNEGRARPTDVF